MGLRAFVAIDPRDMRKGFNGLTPWSPSVWGGAAERRPVPCSPRRHNRLKILFGIEPDSGFVPNDLRTGASWPQATVPGQLKISPDAGGSDDAHRRSGSARSQTASVVSARVTPSGCAKQSSLSFWPCTCCCFGVDDDVAVAELTRQLEAAVSALEATRRENELPVGRLTCWFAGSSGARASSSRPTNWSCCSLAEPAGAAA